MSAPDPRKTSEAVRIVRAAYPFAVLHQNNQRRYPRLAPFSIFSTHHSSALMPLAFGNTPKEAWWNAVPRALAYALTLANRSQQ